MENEDLREAMLNAWISLNGKLKDSQMTAPLTYNESIVMKMVYDRYRTDGVGRTSVQSLLSGTNMLKSLMNRTVNSLCGQGYLHKEREGRKLYVYPLPERLDDFLSIHRHSLEMAEQIIHAIGESNARAFVRICQKFDRAGLHFGQP